MSASAFILAHQVAFAASVGLLQALLWPLALGFVASSKRLARRGLS